MYTICIALVDMTTRFSSTLYNFLINILIIGMLMLLIIVA